MECAGCDNKIERIANCSWIQNVVRLDEHEGIDDGRHERCDRGSRGDAVRSEPGVQGICELSLGGKLGYV